MSTAHWATTKDPSHLTTMSHMIGWLYAHTFSQHIQNHFFIHHWCPPSLVTK